MGDIPPELYAALLPFQLKGVKFALQHEGRVMIGDEMGLGKTVPVFFYALGRIKLLIALLPKPMPKPHPQPKPKPKPKRKPKPKPKLEP